MLDDPPIVNAKRRARANCHTCAVGVDRYVSERLAAFARATAAATTRTQVMGRNESRDAASPFRRCSAMVDPFLRVEIRRPSMLVCLYAAKVQALADRSIAHAGAKLAQRLKR